MRISTKTLASLLLVTAVAAAVPGVSKLPPGRSRKESQFDRLLQRHDRKGELRAELLGLDSHTFRALRSKLTFEEIIKRRGFKDIRAFRLALLGKLKDELRRRGWSAHRIEHFVVSRSMRVS